MVLLAIIFQAFASPWDDPTIVLLERESRVAAADVVHGATLRDPLTWAYRLDRFALTDESDKIVHAEYAAEIERVQGVRSFPWRVVAEGRTSGGDLAPDYGWGDEETGDVSLRGGAAFRVYPSIFEVTANPWIGLDLGEGATGGSVLLPDAWAGIHTAAWTVGFGVRDRWLGPARHGSLLLTDNAVPAPLASASWEGRPWSPIGRFHVEAGAGWLDRARSDVARPGWLLADLRWLPRPEVELGLSRMSIFGGVGRPAPDLGQLLVPTEPHADGDPQAILPDQDELASIDLRLTAPIARWRHADPHPRRVGGIDYVEAYWEYGGEDVIARRVLGIPLPALAGVANLFGGEIASGPLSLTAETSRLLDDKFRWYTGHRVYHDGFTQDGRAMGMASGGDAIATWLALTFFPVRWGVELSVEQIRSVGAIDATDRGIQALATDEIRRRVGIAGWTLASCRRWWRLRSVLERGTGLDFVPGHDAWAWYLAVSR
jgi:hypothetical protein